LDQRFGGIGVRIERKPPTAKALAIRGLIANSPAAKAGLRAGDLITAIDGQPLDDSPLREIVKRIHGPIGSTVTLSLSRAGVDGPFDVAVVRDEIQTDSVFGDARRADGSWDFFLAEHSRIVLVRIMTFGERTAEELRAALNATNARGERAEAVIIDLRDNAGGLLTAAIQSADMLLDRGVIVSTRGRDGTETRRYTARPDLVLPLNIPLAVLVNHNSASASEILAACLQDHGRALVIGERSFGKGTVQNIIPMEGGRSALKLTTASYWRPSNKNIHRRKEARDTDDWGVSPTPDNIIPIDQNQWERIVRYRLYRDDHRDEQRDDQRDDVSAEQPQMKVAPGTENEVSDKDGASDKGGASNNDGAKVEPQATATQEPMDQEASAESGEGGTSETPMRVEDPQLARAIERLRSQLARPDAANTSP
jgi:carboxyl-terminal processing protease